MTSEYLKKWRKAHPHYHRDWMRRNRGTGLEGRDCVRGMKQILGVLVNFKVFEILRRA